MSILHDTIAFCFDETLTRAGPAVRQLARHFLIKKGIKESEISTRFDDVEAVLVEIFGEGGRVMVVETLWRLCQEYSLDLELSYGSSLPNRLDQLKDRILVDKLTPKHYRQSIDTSSFEDKTGAAAGWTG